MDRRPTIRDIAAKAGYHFTTVSLALRDHPSIPERTREKIKRVAEELHYRPDPVLSALMAYRKATSHSPHRAALAWITSGPQRHSWRQVPLAEAAFEGAQQHAEQLGYGLESLWVTEPGMRPERFQDILRTRGIVGLVMAPALPGQAPLELDWQEMAVVGVGQNCLSPRCHRVDFHRNEAVCSLLHLLRQRDYVRSGIVIVGDEDREDPGALLAGHWLDYQRPHIEEAYVPYLRLETWNEERFLTWFEEHLPCAVIAENRKCIAALRRHGYRVPEDVGVVSPGLFGAADKDLSGYLLNARDVGVATIDFIVGMLHRQERGLPEQPRHLLIGGRWQEGTTLLADNPRRMLKLHQQRHPLSNGHQKLAGTRNGNGAH